MRRESTHLGTTALLTVAAVLAVLSAGHLTVGTAALVLQVLGGVPLVLILPGYALSLLSVPSTGSSVVLWRGMWAVGLSLAVNVLGGLALNLTPAGLTRTDWSGMLAAVTLLSLGGTAVVRSRRLRCAPSPSQRRQPESPAAASRGAVSRLAVAGCSLAALLLVGAAVWLGVASAAWQRPAGFAQLWLVPARTAHATLGVRNAYPGTEHFHLVLQRGSQPVSRWDLTLAAGATWRVTLHADSRTMHAELTIPGQHMSPRQVALRAAG